MTKRASLETNVGPAPLRAPPGLAVRAVIALRKTLQRTADKLTPPGLVMFEKVTAAGGALVVGELARLGVADCLGDGPRTADELARETGCDADAMKRAMRAAIAIGVFTRDRDGRYANNRLSTMLRSDDPASVRSLAEYFASTSNVHAWADLPETLRTGKNAFERVHGMSVWEWFDRNPHERETFAHAMMGMTLLEAPGIADSYPFGAIGTLCDVGGGRGTLLSEILLHHPSVKGILCDAPGVLDSAKVFLAKRGVLDRVELAPGSFFESVPRGADAYMMKSILHDWDDARSAKILATCRAAMEAGAKMLIVEMLVEDDHEDYGALSDVQMMVVCSDGRERSRADYERLLRESGFRLEKVWDAPTPTSILESVAI